MGINEEIVLGSLVGSYLLLLLVEYLLVKRRKMDFITDEYALINLGIASVQQLFGALHTLLFISGFVYVQENWSIQHFTSLQEIRADWPLTFGSTFPYIQVDWAMTMGWILVIIIADFCQYWLHRWSHEVNILWAGHVVHHSNTDYNFSIALRQSFIEGFYTWIFYLPLAFLGVPWELFISAYAVSLLWQFLVHTRLVGKLGFLENFMSTPSHHRVHHGRNEVYLDKNYGAFFIIWDKMFGTFQKEMEEPEYGITVPLESNNLLWINVHQHAHIIKTAAATGSFRNKLKVLFGKPSYTPGDVAPPVANPDIRIIIDRPEKKAYIFLSFLSTAVLGFWAVNYFHETQAFLPFALMIPAIFGSMVITCSLLEHSWADKAEVVRLLLFALAGAILIGSNEQVLGAAIFSVSLFLLASTGLVALKYKQLQMS